MDLKPLAEVDLREAIGPINRAVTGHYLPSVRTVSYLRERAAAGVLDLKLSRCAYIGRDLVGTCLVERVDEWAYLDAIGVDPLAQQRGVGHALLESACVAAEALLVRRFTAEVSESDAPAMATLSRAGFAARRGLARWGLKGSPVVHPLPEVISEASEVSRATPGQVLARQVELSEALSFLATLDLPEPPFAKRPAVLERIKGRLQAFLLMQLEASQPVLGAAVLERERHEIVCLGGDPQRLLPLAALLCQRHGATHCDSLPEDDPAAAVLAEAGMLRLAVRSEVQRLFR